MKKLTGAVCLVAACLFAPQLARAQCYAFSSGSAASLVLNITNLPTPTNVSEGSNGQTLYTYTLTGLSGNSVTMSVVGTVYSSTSPNPFVITVFQYPGVDTVVNISADLGSTSAAITLTDGSADVLPSGLTPVLPGIANWSTTATLTTTISSTNTTYQLTAVTSDCSAPTSGKANGQCGPCSGQIGSTSAGEPINVATGNLFESKVDYTTAGPNPLYFTRYYNSQASYNGTFAGTMGNWRTPFDRYLQISPASSPTTVVAERADGQMLTFTGSGSSWATDTDVDYTLTHSGTTWTLTGPDDTVETYNDNSAGEGVLATITLRDGYTQTMSYSSGLLSSVSDSYSRTLGFTYTSGLLTKVTNPDSSTTGVQYGYDSNNALTTVKYPTGTGTTTLTYVYGNSSLPLALTGITDENGNTYATWGYDSAGHATSNYMGGSGLSANSITLSYASSTPTVTNAFGVVDTYTFSTLQGVPKVTEIDRASTGTTAAAHRYFTYDSNGCLATSKDWDGNETSYSNNSHCLPAGSSAIQEAYGSGVARTTGITYDTTCIHLPATVTKTGVTITFAYDASCNVHTRTETDTTSGSTPYSTNGTARTWTYTYSGTGQLETVTGPRTDLTQETQYTYSGGVLTSIEDAASHTTTINTYTNGGQPTKITDPNSVVRTYTYDFIDGGLQKMLTSTVDTSGGNYTTTYGHDSDGNLTKVTMPDSTYSTTTYDNARRPTKFTNANGEYISYTLDQLGGRTEEDIYNSSSTRTRKHTRTFDALGRLLTDVGWPTTGTSLTTTYAYDPQGNATSIEDRRGNTTGYSYDALNRQYQVTDRLSHTTTTAYDTNDNVTSVTDPNSNATSYTRDGFGRAIQIASPDSGTSVYHFDLAGNMTKKVDGASVETDATYDALNRELTRTFPADSTHNISKTYDQTGGSFGYGDGIGHLTSMTDNSGTMHRSFEERGNVVHLQRLNGSSQIDSYAYYDQNNRNWAYVNPDQWAIEIWRDNAGQVTGLSSYQQSGSWVWTGFAAVISSVTHLPFGPVSGLSFANGITKTNTYDLDYRLTETKDAATASVMDLSYTYDGNGNPTAITDAVNPANTMTTTATGQGYDKKDRFLGGSSGTGGYGDFTYTYGNNGERLTETQNATTMTYTYNSGTNQIHGFNDSNNTNYVYNGAGEITKQYYGSYYDLNYIDDVTQQLYQPVYQGYGSPSFSASYDGFGMRQGKSSNVYWTYGYGVDGTTLIEESSTGGQRVNYLYLDGQLIALNEETGVGGGSPTEATYYVHADRLGTPQAVTDGSKTVQWKQLYEPFGWPSSYSNPGNIVQDFGFPGQIDDAEDDVAYNGSRYYNYLTGAYIQTDFADILQSGTTNTYTYANSNPFRFTDRSGMALGVTCPAGTHPQLNVGCLVGDEAMAAPATIILALMAYNSANACRINPLALIPAIGYTGLLVASQEAYIANCTECELDNPLPPITVHSDNPSGIPISK
jgi:RHS repeat-associated protein